MKSSASGIGSSCTYEKVVSEMRVLEEGLAAVELAEKASPCPVYV